MIMIMNSQQKKLVPFFLNLSVDSYQEFLLTQERSSWACSIFVSV